MSPSPSSSTNPPELLDLTIDNITPNTILINSQCPDPRLRYLLSRLVTHLHDFARETRLSTSEWLTALEFLVDCGKISSDVRKEFILLSDILGLSLLVDNINHPTPSSSAAYPPATESSVLGPFHRHDAPHLPNGSSISDDPLGEPMLCVATVRSYSTNLPVKNCEVDVWETDSSGFYDVQKDGESGVSERAVLKTDDQGKCWFKLVKPVAYPIPSDGPVGKLLKKLGRHCWRPAHLHFMFRPEEEKKEEEEGEGIMDGLVTALYLRGDPYEKSDAVFGVKSSLIVEPRKVEDPKESERLGIEVGTWLLEHEFVLTTREETDRLRDLNAKEALDRLGEAGKGMTLVDHLPVPEVD